MEPPPIEGTRRKHLAPTRVVVHEHGDDDAAAQPRALDAIERQEAVPGREAFGDAAGQGHDLAGARLVHGLAGFRPRHPRRSGRLDPRLVRLPRLQHLADGFPRLRPFRQAGRPSRHRGAGRARPACRHRLHLQDRQHRPAEPDRLLVRRAARGVVRAEASRSREAPRPRRHGLHRQGLTDADQARAEDGRMEVERDAPDRP